MDDLIVVILTLVVAGFGLLGQLNKKKQAAAGNKTQKASESFWDLIQGETGNQEAEVEQEYDNSESEYEPEIGEHQLGKQVEKVKFRTSLGVEAQSAFKSTEIINTTKPKPKSKIKAEFSLRKAVVYSEILNRKYT